MNIYILHKDNIQIHFYKKKKFIVFVDVFTMDESGNHQILDSYPLDYIIEKIPVSFTNKKGSAHSLTMARFIWKGMVERGFMPLNHECHE